MEICFFLGFSIGIIVKSKKTVSNRTIHSSLNLKNSLSLSSSQSLSEKKIAGNETLNPFSSLRTTNFFH
jgi:hypothetical protein